MSSKQPPYADLESQKELLAETQRSWKSCADVLKAAEADLRVQKEMNVSLQAPVQAINGLRDTLADTEAKNVELMKKNAEHRSELRHYMDQYQWQYQAEAGSNAEAREPSW